MPEEIFQDKPRPGFLQRAGRRFRTGVQGGTPISAEVAAAVGHPELEGISREDLEMLLKQPKLKAETESEQALAKQRTAKAEFEKKRPSMLAKEDETVFKLAVQSEYKDPTFAFLPPEEQQARLADKFAILKAAKGGKAKTPLPSLEQGARFDEKTIKTPEDIKKAIASGKLKKERGLQILKERFKFK